MASLSLLLQLGLLLISTWTIVQEAPNIVLILTDDQDLRMHSLQYMPKVQKYLADEGTSYVRHYAPAALCCPARVSIMTGLHAHNHLVTDVNGPFGGWKQILARGFNDDYLPIWLQNAGYHTYYTGKLYNGMSVKCVEKMTARGWTEADVLIGFNTYQYNDPPFQHIEGDWNNPEKVQTLHDQYSTDKVANHSYHYLQEAVKHDAPFFVGIAPIAPHSQNGKNHGPPVPALKYNDTLAGVKIPRADNFNPADKSGVNVVWTLNRLNDTQVEHLDYYYQRRSESLLSVDDLVEGVVDILNRTGQLDNTYIIYTSDNGYHLGHHRLRAGKKYAFEEDINVPLIIRGPNVPKGRTTDIISAHIDLSPTILHMAGITQRSAFDGKPIPVSATAIQAQEASGADEHVNIEFWTGQTYSTNGLKGRRVNSFKSLRLIGNGYDIMYAVQCQNNSHELYDMVEDAVQMRNLHPTAPAEEGESNPYHSGYNQLAGYDIQQLLPRIDALLLVLKSCKGDACSNPWKQLHSDGTVRNLRDAMNQTYDDNYHNLPKVEFRVCFKNGTVDLWAEGPQWHPGLADADRWVNLELFERNAEVLDTLPVALNVSNDAMCPDEDAVDEDGKEPIYPTDWQSLGYWDDWE